MSDQQFRDLGEVSAYEILGVAEGASKSEIDQAYLAKVRVAHPDVAGDADAAERTRLLNLAVRMLRLHRAEYDAYLHRPDPAPTTPSRPPDDFSAADDPWDRADTGPPAPDPWSATGHGPPAPPPRSPPPYPPPPPPPMPYPPPRRRRRWWPLLVCVGIAAYLLHLGLGIVQLAAGD